MGISIDPDGNYVWDTNGVPAGTDNLTAAKAQAGERLAYQNWAASNIYGELEH